MGVSVLGLARNCAERATYEGQPLCNRVSLPIRFVNFEKMDANQNWLAFPNVTKSREPTSFGDFGYDFLRGVAVIP